MGKIPTDYKRTYTTYDNVAVAPDDEIWVPIYNTEEDKCQQHCDESNEVLE
jgi:hypothetical protein